MEEKRLGMIGIVIEDLEQAEQVNELIHQANELVVARLGIPYRERGVSVISLVVDGSMEAISCLTGKLGRLTGVSVKSMLTKDKK